MSMVSKIDHNSYTKIPDEIISQAGLKPGDDVIWFYDEQTKQIILMEKPLDFSKALRGLGPRNISKRKESHGNNQKLDYYI